MSTTTTHVLPNDVEKGPVDPNENAARFFETAVSKNIGKFKKSRLQSDQRLGVILLFNYKNALDEMNQHYGLLVSYMNRPSYSSRNLLTFNTERYIKARDLYMLHLKEQADETRDAYEESLISTATSIMTQIWDGLYDAPRFPKVFANKSLEPALGLINQKPFEAITSELDFFSETQWSWVHSPTGPPIDEEFTKAEKVLSRSIIALLGGFALLVPMLIMKLNSTTLTVCLTTTLFVIAAALLLARFMITKDATDVFGLTTAYAAVLVVLVGTTSTKGGPDNKTVAIIMGAVCGGLVVVVYLTCWLLLNREFSKYWSIIRGPIETEQ